MAGIHLSNRPRGDIEGDWNAQFEVSRIPTSGDWDTYRKSWSKNHRRNMNRCRRRLNESGDTQTRVYSNVSADQVEPLMRTGFSIEDRSWKGETGTSVLRSPRMFDFYLRQAQRLVRWGQLEIAFLDHDGRPIAFEYAIFEKSVYHSFKVGCDAQFASFSPGQLLMSDLLGICFRDPQRRAVDCMGPLSDALARWQGTTYSVRPSGRRTTQDPGTYVTLRLPSHLALRPPVENVTDEKRNGPVGTGWMRNGQRMKRKYPGERRDSDRGQHLFPAPDCRSRENLRHRSATPGAPG